MRVIFGALLVVVIAWWLWTKFLKSSHVISFDANAANTVGAGQ